MESLATREYEIRKAVWHQPIGLYGIYLVEIVWNPQSAVWHQPIGLYGIHLIEMVWNLRIAQYGIREAVYLNRYTFSTLSNSGLNINTKFIIFLG